MRAASPVDLETASPRSRIMAEAAALQRKHERLDRVRASKERMLGSSASASSLSASASEHWVQVSVETNQNQRESTGRCSYESSMGV